MAEPKENPLMEKIVSLCKRRGFIYQSSEIYGGINGFWDYGPLGAELKRNVKELWWNTMTREREDVVGLDATIIMSPAIWKASGHVDTFVDMMRECPLTRKRVRVDQVEPQSGTVQRYAGAVDRSSESPAGAIPEWVLREYNTCVSECGIEDGTQIDKEALKYRIIPGFQHTMVPSEKWESTAERWAEDLLRSTTWKPFAILLPSGKPPESARKSATLFYEQMKLSKACLLGERMEKVKDSVDFHPESLCELTEPRPFNLMFKTYVGPVESEDGVAYLRPETAQAIFAQFKNVVDSSPVKVPFGIGQIGKAFRNEVTPRNYTFRSREFEQMELEFFIAPDEAIEALHGSVATVPAAGHPGEPQGNWGWEAWHRYWVEERVKFYEGIGLSRDTLGFHVQTPEELAHYARACTDILYKFPFSKRDEKGELKGEELEGIAARGDFDLSQHEKSSGKPLNVFEDELRAAWGKVTEDKKKDMRDKFVASKTRVCIEKKKMSPEEAAAEAQQEAQVFFDRLAKGQYIPHVIEPSAGVDRLILALISNAYCEDQMPDEKGKMQVRVMMKFHPRIAPIKVAVLPLLKNKPDLVTKAREVYSSLKGHFACFYDDGGAIGKRYRRQDEIGTPFCVTIDFDTLGEKGPELKDTVTLRYRDDGRQERVKTSELLAVLSEKLR